MARPRRTDPQMVAKAEQVVARTGNIESLRMAQAVLLPAVGHLSLEQTAKVLGVGRATVARLQRRFRQQDELVAEARARWGGRRRALLSLEKERAFLAAWKVRAVRASVVYRLLKRHGWRKVAPDTRHPKSDPAVQAEWKKKRYRKSWRPC